MIGPVLAWPDEPAGWIRVGEARAIPSRFSGSTTVDGFAVVLRAVSTGLTGPGATEVTVEQPMAAAGPPVTLSVLRKVTVDQIVKTAIAQLSRQAVSAEDETGIPGAFRVEGDDRIWTGRPAMAAGRGRDTQDDRLIRVAEIYLTALAQSRPPVNAVAKDLPASRSTAGRLVGQARKAGLLRETTQGKASAAEWPVRVDPVNEPQPGQHRGPGIFRPVRGDVGGREST